MNENLESEKPTLSDWDETIFHTGFNIIDDKGSRQSYEFDSKSFNNCYYAYMLRHNSNVLKPDPAKTVELKALSEVFFKDLS